MGIVERLRAHALPDPHDEREVMHAPLLAEAADEIERLLAECAKWQYQCEVNFGHCKTYAEIAERNGTRADNLQRERDEADRRAGSAERKLAAQATPNVELTGAAPTEGETKL